MRRLSIACGVVVLAGVAFTLQPQANAQPAPSRVLDRTFRCPVGVSGGIRSVNVYAQAGIRELGDRSKWHTLANFYVNPTEGASSIGARAGGPVADPTRASSSSFWAVGCMRSSEPTALSPGPLGGGRASQFVDHYQCPAPRVVLVRVRVEFATPVSVGRETRARVRAAYLAVRTTAGKPIAYANVLESGRARIFTASSCVEE